MLVGTDLNVTWAEFDRECARLAERQPSDIASVWGIPTGGSLVALQVARHLGVRVVDSPSARTLIVDDLVDSGATMAPWAEGWHDALYRKPHSPYGLAPDATTHDGWVRFPWERDGGDPTDSVRRLLEFIGEDPTRDGLRDTPARVVKALGEMTAGYGQSPGAILSTCFDVEECDEMVVVRAIPFVSLCEHHMLPFTGTATIGYIPDGRVVGLSKLARLVDIFARRLQVQERMTIQIADAIGDHLSPRGVGVVIRATHSCMSARGVGKTAEMVTSRLRGAILEVPQARAEFMALTQS